MSRNVLIAVIAGIVVVAGAGGYLYMNQQQESAQENVVSPTEEPSAMEEDPVSGQSSIVELMQRQGSLTCTYEDEETNSTGTVYIGAGNFRGDFEIESEEGLISSHMINTGDNVYVWSEDSEQGVTFSIEELEEINDNEQRPNTVDLEQKFSYDCSSWSVDNSLFNPPEDIDFIDFGEFINPEAMMGEDAEPIEGTSDQCAACESLSGDARTQCLSALGC